MNFPVTHKGQFYSPVVAQSGSLGSSATEDQARKKEMRLLKNREAARECRRKKKEYIKCLENRVAVLENQNKTLIDELKTLKELYCQQKVEWDSTRPLAATHSVAWAAWSLFKLWHGNKRVLGPGIRLWRTLGCVWVWLLSFGLRRAVTVQA